jgi:hypothetical protein
MDKPERKKPNERLQSGLQNAALWFFLPVMRHGKESIQIIWMAAVWKRV